jgi:hypothetical protein
MKQIKEMDQVILSKAKHELELEQQKRDEQKQKVFQQKQLQDEMLQKA